MNVYPWGLWEDYAFVSEYRGNVIKWERMYGNLLLELLKSRKAAQKMGKGQKSMNRRFNVSCIHWKTFTYYKKHFFKD